MSNEFIIWTDFGHNRSEKKECTPKKFSNESYEIASKSFRQLEWIFNSLIQK